MIERAASADVTDIVRLTNAAYERGEAGIWLPGWTRTTIEWTQTEVSAGEIFVARGNGKVIGAVRVSRVRSDTAEFGRLAVDPKCSGVGVGRALIDFAERLHDVDWMQLELLIPRVPHRHKQQLHEWYTRLGYRPMLRRDFAAVYPEQSGLLAGPADLVTYRKALCEGA